MKTPNQRPSRPAKESNPPSTSTAPCAKVTNPGCRDEQSDDEGIRHADATSTSCEPNPPMFSDKWWITDERFEALKQALKRGQGDFTQQEFQQVVEWVKKVELKHLAMKLLFEGFAKVDVRNAEGEPAFSPDETDDAIVNSVNQNQRQLLQEYAEISLQEIAKQQGLKTPQSSEVQHP